MQYDTIIIGAGIGGLSSGLKLSSAGRRVLILERQPVAGGCAVNFTRKGFTFESAMHCIDSLGQGGEVRNFLDDFGVSQKLEFIELKDFCRIIYPEHDFIVDFDRRSFFDFLEKSFYQEKDNLEKLSRDLDKFYTQFDKFCISELPAFIQLALSPFFYRQMFKVSPLTVDKFLRRYLKDDKLKSIISDLWRFLGVVPDRLSALYFLLILRGYYFEKTCYVRGGYGRLFKAMTDKIIENGSQIKLSTGVKRIICERKAVKGVVTENGEEFFARTVISNANAIETLSGFLDDGLLRQKYEQKFSQLEKSISAFQVYLGLNTTAKALGMTNFMFSINTSYDHTENFKANLDENFDNCFIELVDHSQVDPSLAPQGKSTLLIMTFDSYGRWQDLTAEQYRQKKEMLARKLIQRSEKYLPGLAKHIEIMEIATPKTMQRYTLSPEGAIYGFAHTPGQSGIFRLGQKTDVRGLFLAGSWTRPGAGIHACFISGLDAAELALKFLD